MSPCRCVSSGNSNDFRFFSLAAKMQYSFCSVHYGHYHVCNDKIRLRFRENLESLSPVRRFEHFISPSFQDAPQVPPYVLFVVNNQDSLQILDLCSDMPAHCRCLVVPDTHTEIPRNLTLKPACCSSPTGLTVASRNWTPTREPASVKNFFMAFDLAPARHASHNYNLA